ncbi:MAG: RidA family protein, partial [Ignavibacteriaceae bacterium]|nr:RidA family protein [Ignavibacteriaceae bacterium]
DPYQQTKFIIRKIERAISEAGGSLEDVIRTRIYVTNINDWSAIGKAHGEFFRNIKPATTMVEVKSLIDPNFVVELEATAILPEK